ncbi:MAG: GreA/GreB family elongation factor [Treponema sp.]|jgi:transcription elongation GreA/GreB family factor|nr:GreA/GreB family elongation factor [Treponema sp.]
MAIYLTSNGKEMLLEELKTLQKSLQELTDEKNFAYNNCGDTWHDNPTFNELEQKEGRMMLKIQEKQGIIYNAIIIDNGKRNIEKVAIGSIVMVEKYIKKEKTYSNEIWEIAGFSESDPENNKIAYNTPLGKILLNMKEGEVKEMENSIDGTVEYKVLKLLADWEK